jgi:hypothetical protein
VCLYGVLIIIIIDAFDNNAFVYVRMRVFDIALPVEAASCNRLRANFKGACFNDHH